MKANLLRWRQAVGARVATAVPRLRAAWSQRPTRIGITIGSAVVLVAATIGIGMGVAQAADAEHAPGGSFDTGLGSWFAYPAPAQWENPPGQLCTDVPDGITPRFNAGAGFTGLNMVPGEKYQVKITASASKPVTVRLAMQITGAPFTAPLDTLIDLDTTPRTFTFADVAWTADKVAGTEDQFIVHLGENGAFRFCMDDISVFGPTESSEVPDPAPNTQLAINGTFDSTTVPWTSYGGTGPAYLNNGRLCLDLPAHSTPGNTFDAAIQLNGISLKNGFNYKLAFTASSTVPVVVRTVVGRGASPFETFVDLPTKLETANTDFTFGGPLTNFDPFPTMKNGQIAFQVGGLLPAFTFCIDNVSLLANTPRDPYVPDTGPRVRVNQNAYLPEGPKNATLVTDATTALPWQLKNSSGRVVASGRTVPRGVDASSGQNVHSIDFSRFERSGTGFTLTADGQTSFPFDISKAAYDKLRLDALKFYYTQRSGIEILDSLRPGGYARAAGHVQVAPNQGDISVPCLPGTCSYSLDVRGGWYDAGDQGKYVVNGGISVAQIMSEYERAALLGGPHSAVLRDNTLAIPESGNRVPDILDEARWEMRFMLSMQVPDGQPLAGMVHHKIHDENWTSLPTLPANDSQPRFLHPPSTAATLNLAATGAQCARVFARFDRALANQCLAEARKAWAAALANPDVFAPGSDNVGGGPYDDTNVSDEFYWAAAELYITTGEKAFRDYVLASPLNTSDIFLADGFFWGGTAPLGRLDLALLPNHLPGRNAVRASVLAGADRYLATLNAHPYGTPYAPTGNQYAWGSNSSVLNNMVVMAYAHDISGKEKYRDGVIEGMNYILGRNALNQSYVTGYGEHASENEHSRWYAAMLSTTLPHPPAGTLAGGANSGIQDPIAGQLLRGCAPQFCYVDHIGSFATNEEAVNWNSTLAWNAGWLADEADD